MTKRLPYTQAEIATVCRALKAVGETVMGVERLPEGGFRVLTAANATEKALSPLEAWEREHGDRAA